MTDNLTKLYKSRHERVLREDLVVFINACFACTGQREFYSSATDQEVSVEFLHGYILGNYRRLYALALAAGINHFNQGLIIQNLLASGKGVDLEQKRAEGRLIGAILGLMPASTAFRILRAVRKRGINNRRTRAIMKEYLASRRDQVFDAVKYRAKVKHLVAHAHIPMPGEFGTFLFGKFPKRFATPLFEAYRKAHFSESEIYSLPFTIAEGMAAQKGVSRERFLSKIKKQMTEHEKLRLMQASDRASVDLGADLSRFSLTRLMLYLLSLKIETRRERYQEFTDVVDRKCRYLTRDLPSGPGRVATVLDVSYSSAGSLEKKRRPLAVALAVHYLLDCAADAYTAF